MNHKLAVSIPVGHCIWALGLSALMFWVAAVSPGAAGGPLRTVRIGVYQNEPKIFMDQNGHAAGIFIDLLNAIAAQDDWKVVYVLCQWTVCLQDLQNGKIDLMPDVAYSVDRDAIFDFHQIPILESWSVVYANQGSSINDLSQLMASGWLC